MKKILLVAAENSAENYALQVILENQSRGEPMQFCGVGGDRLAEAGVDIWVHSRELSVVGIVEVLLHLPRILGCLRRLFRRAREERVDAALLIDYPDFNLKLAKKLKSAGIPVYTYISPTVWAWRYSRVKRLRRWVDHLFIIFPFERPIYQKERIPFTYTGHPLLPLIRRQRPAEAVRSGLGVGPGGKLVALFPGSRHQEVKALLPPMLRAVERLKERFPVTSVTAVTAITVVIVRADNIEPSFIARFLAGRDLPVVGQGERFDIMGAADGVLTTCGTSNLEMALIGAPFVAAYRVNWLSYILGKWMVKIPLYSIVNILAGKGVVPELIQSRCKSSRMAEELEKLLTDPNVAAAMREHFAAIQRDLARERTPAAIICDRLTADLAGGR